MKRRYGKIIAVVLCSLMLLQSFGLGGASLIASAGSNGRTGVLYTESFDGADFGSLEGKGVWGIESAEKTNATAPELTNGVMSMVTKNSVQFKWTEVDDVGEYDPTKIYSFDFDVKVTDSGSGSTWNSADHTRILYVAMGGWYNQVEINNKDGKIRAGETYNTYTSSTYSQLHVRISLEGNTITSVIRDMNGNLLMSGTRSNSAYTDMNARNGCMKALILRCEDGGAQIDNFKFSVESFEKISSTELLIPSGKQAVYEGKVSFNSGDNISVKLGGNDIFTINDEGIRVCACKTDGVYGAGEYNVKAYVNPKQEMMYVEITLPDGGVLRRGSYQSLGGDRIDCFASKSDAISDIKVEYVSINTNKYELVSTEPLSKGFESKVYNIISSFDYASSTRYFSWTAKASFIGNDGMALKYRKAGDTAWISVDAERAVENTKISSEDYFKADLEDLRPNTKYEYMIGKKGSSDEHNDWSDVYSFTTAPLDIDSFSFIAVGDTQALSWGGDEQNNKGYKYAMAAIEEAIKETGSPAFLLNAGDVTDKGSSRDMWNWYFKSLGEYAYSLPHFATMGNHDTWTDDMNNHFALHFNHPNNGGDKEVDSEWADKATENYATILLDNMDETFYSYDYGDAHFIVLNSGTYGSQDRYILEAQREWLEYDLEMNADARWKIILVHEAVYHRKGGSESRPWLYDTIEKHGVDLVIQGHSHLVTRTYPMKNGEIVTKKSPDLIQKGTGTVYTTIGSTTLNHDTIGNPNVEECMTILTPDNYQAAYTAVTVTENNIRMTIKQLNGYVLDEFVITTGVDDLPEGYPDGSTPENDGAVSDNNNNDDSNDNSNSGNNDGNNTSGDTTDAPNVTEPPKATEPEKQKGCGGLVGNAAVVALAVVTLGFGISFKKKD